MERQDSDPDVLKLFAAAVLPDRLPHPHILVKLCDPFVQMRKLRLRIKDCPKEAEQHS